MEKADTFLNRKANMVLFERDKEIDSLGPDEDIEQLTLLISLLCGQEIDLERLPSESELAIVGFLRNSPHKKNIRLSHEEFNELLLLFNQERVEPPFFTFFFLNKDPRPDFFLKKDIRPEQTSAQAKDFITFHQLKKGVKKFRGFALLCFGNFRFAFRKLSEEKNPYQFMRLLDPWSRNSKGEKREFEKRQEPLIPLSGTEEIEEDKTWLLGYISGASLKEDGETLLKLLDKPGKTIPHPACKDDLVKLKKDEDATKNKGQRNSIKYLTWDYLDIYVATSMRQRWEYEETYAFLKKVFHKLCIPKVRWFDPTQAHYESTIDKGLLEGLMLKRAKCTIYMAQEGDTLGKDSELAATLAQGKPVVAYVPRINGKDLPKYKKALQNRPLKYFRQRLLTLYADGFFDKLKNSTKVSALLKILRLEVRPENLKVEVDKLLKCFSEFEDNRLFKLIGREENDFRTKHNTEIERAANLLAAIESAAADNRAYTIQIQHPLALQVHLESGVANGILVARNDKECADLVRGVLLRNLVFDIDLLHRNPKVEDISERLPTWPRGFELPNHLKNKIKYDAERGLLILKEIITKKEKDGLLYHSYPLKDDQFQKAIKRLFRKQSIATALLEKTTKSRFRVVTNDESLTNSFWNFYLETVEPHWYTLEVEGR